MMTNNRADQPAGDSSKAAFERLKIALGVKSKEELLKLLAKDPEARRLTKRILGVSSPMGVKSALGMADDKTTHPLSSGGNGDKAKIKF